MAEKREHKVYGTQGSYTSKTGTINGKGYSAGVSRDRHGKKKSSSVSVHTPDGGTVSQSKEDGVKKRIKYGPPARTSQSTTRYKKGVTPGGKSTYHAVRETTPGKKPIKITTVERKKVMQNVGRSVEHVRGIKGNSRLKKITSEGASKKYLEKDSDGTSRRREIKKGKK